MRFIITDLEWNGSYTRKAHGYFNEIIEIGAVKVGDTLDHAETFHAVIRPVVSRKLTTLVTDLTNITPEELEQGMTFERAVTLFREWIGDEEAVLATWSNTDLLVLMENFRYYYRKETIPFATHYVDLQRYCQQQLEQSGGNQLGLSRAAEMVGISDEGMSLHRALDDSILTARVLKALYDPAALAPYVWAMDDTFYERIRFKPFFIRDIRHPAVQKKDFRFRCESCGRRLQQKNNWQFKNHAFCADLECRCGRQYVGRVQLRQLFDSVETRQRLIDKKPKEAKTGQTAVSKQKV